MSYMRPYSYRDEEEEDALKKKFDVNKPPTRRTQVTQEEADYWLRDSADQNMQNRINESKQVNL